MIEVLNIIATSWPIALMAIFASAAILLNRRWKQYQDDQAAIHNLRTTNAVVVKHERPLFRDNAG